MLLPAPQMYAAPLYPMEISDGRVGSEVDRAVQLEPAEEETYTSPMFVIATAYVTEDVAIVSTESKEQSSTLLTSDHDAPALVER